ncbi:MAG TPA: MarR family transcriptional regulator [Lactobacillaceae bacterium]|jgi:DNA-binding MarR family transcriptional regulator
MNLAEKQQALIGEMADLFGKISAYNKPIMERVFADLTLSEIETIELIATIEDANVTKLAEKSYMTRGAISKMAKKMQAKNLIETYQHASNKKEIYFRLTPAGEAIEQQHRQMHAEFFKRDQVVFEQVSEKTLDDMRAFIATYTQYMDDLKQQS